MKKKIITTVILAALMAGTLAGCGSKEKSAGASGSGEKTLNVLTWEGDVADDVVASFEKEYGVKVNVTYVEDTNTILAKMLQGSDEYDVIDVESAYIKSFVDADLLAPLDYDKMTNYDNIDPVYLKRGAVGDEDMKYSLPLSGPLYTGVVVNKETCPIEIKSFADLADPALKGQLWCTSTTGSLYTAALDALGYQPDSSDENELNEAQELLKKIKSNVKAFGTSSISSLETGDCSVAFTYDYNVLMCDDKANWNKFELIPDTAMGYTQYWTVAASSENQDLANEFINCTYSVDSEVALINEWGGVPLLKTDLIKDKIDSDYFDNPMLQQCKDMWSDHQANLSMNDDQIAITDTLYNELMSGN